jgi:indole-3-glycerol phosphate synthase
MAEDKKDILKKIVERTRHTVELRKGLFPYAILEKYPYFSREIISVSGRLRTDQGNGVIAEFKRQSPSKGVINQDADPVEVAMAYEAYGASAMSVLTDEPFFGGSNDDLMRIREAVQLPLLRKDFVIDEYQLLEAKAIGADFVLLIAACLSPVEVKKLASVANQLGLEVLLELHEQVELEHYCDHVQLVGINNRSLKHFDVDLQRSLDMANSLPADTLKVAESGIHSVDQLIHFRSHGFDAFLIGEHFMKQQDPGTTFRVFSETLKAVS